jgi:hypothetical protein
VAGLPRRLLLPRNRTTAAPACDGEFVPIGEVASLAALTYPRYR